MNKQKRIIIIMIAAVLLGLFAVTRITKFTTYFPLSGKIFSIDPVDAGVIFVQNGTTGEQHFFETVEEKALIIEQLEALRYRFWIPTIPVASGGWSWRVAIEADGKQYTYYFGNGHMTVNGLVYFIPAKQLDALRVYVEP